MSRINLGRVAIGGLLAGFIINVGEFILNGVLLEEDMNCGHGRAQQASRRSGHDHLVRPVQLRVGIHAGVDVCRDPAAIRRRHEDGDLRIDAVWGLGVPLSQTCL